MRRSQCIAIIMGTAKDGASRAVVQSLLSGHIKRMRAQICWSLGQSIRGRARALRVEISAQAGPNRWAPPSAHAFPLVIGPR